MDWLFVDPSVSVHYLFFICVGSVCWVNEVSEEGIIFIDLLLPCILLIFWVEGWLESLLLQVFSSFSLCFKIFGQLFLFRSGFFNGSFTFCLRIFAFSWSCFCQFGLDSCILWGYFYLTFAITRFFGNKLLWLILNQLKMVWVVSLSISVIDTNIKLRIFFFLFIRLLL